MYPKILTIPAFTAFGSTIGPFTLHTYGLLLAIAFLVALFVVSRQARKAGLDSAKVTDLSIYVLLAGLVGARLLLVVVDWNRLEWSWRDFVGLLQSAGVFYGGLLAALPVAFWYIRRHHLPLWATIDVLAPGVAIGQAIGRLGCLCAGCCYGRPSDVPWAITFQDPLAHEQVGTPLGTPIHPTQIYESLATLAIFFLLLGIARRKRFEGAVFVAYLFTYAAARFVIEFYRGDAVRGTVLGGALSTSQFIALLVFVAAAALTPILAKKRPVGSEPA